MASAWGKSWGHSWGDAFGSISVGECSYDNGNVYDNVYAYEADACLVITPPSNTHGMYFRPVKKINRKKENDEALLVMLGML